MEEILVTRILVEPGNVRKSVDTLQLCFSPSLGGQLPVRFKKNSSSLIEEKIMLTVILVSVTTCLLQYLWVQILVRTQNSFHRSNYYFG